MVDKNNYAIVFSGGGALGSWEVGCYEAILEHHNLKKPSIVSGASAGGLNASAIAYGYDPDKLSKIWTGLRNNDVYLKKRLQIILKVFKTIPWLLKGKFISKYLADIKSIYDNSPLEKTLEKKFYNLNDNLDNLKLDLAISLSHLSTSSQIVLYHTIDKRVPRAVNCEWKRLNTKKELISGLMGTSAIPIIFEPYNNLTIGGMKGLSDGGILRNQPIGPAMQLGIEIECRLVYVIIPSIVQAHSLNNVKDSLSALFNTWLNISYEWQIELTKVLNKVRKNQNNEIALCIIRPTKDLTNEYKVGLLDFGINVSALIKDGLKTTKEKLSIFAVNDEKTWY